MNIKNKNKNKTESCISITLRKISESTKIVHCFLTRFYYCHSNSHTIYYYWWPKEANSSSLVPSSLSPKYCFPKQRIIFVREISHKTIVPSSLSPIIAVVYLVFPVYETICDVKPLVSPNTSTVSCTTLVLGLTTTTGGETPAPVSVYVDA